MWHKALSMGYLMRLELTLVSFGWSSWFISGLFSSFLECVYFGMLYPFFDICYVYVCVGVVLGFTNSFFSVCKCVSWGVLWF